MNKYDFYNNYQNSFLNFVFEKISRNTKNRFVDKTNDSIEILLSNHPCIKVIPLFKKIDKENLSLEKEIEEACKIINIGEFTYVYFVYPRNDNFEKHIEVKVPQLEEACSDYMVKVIPYSLNDLINYKKGKCNGNSNILCK
jgi:hypothetical protein